MQNKNLKLFCKGAVDGGRYLKWRKSQKWDTINAEVVVSSMHRPGTIVADALRAVARCSFIDHGVHVYGYNPLYKHPAVTGYPIPASPFHNAYRWLHTNFKPEVPTKVLAGGNKEEYKDSVKRAFWRTSLNLDAWFVLSDAASRSSADVVIWLENDGFVHDCTVFEIKIQRFLKSGADGASCYGHEKTTYHGNGAVCIMFLRSKLPAILKHVLGYHMVQPFDWILSDYAHATQKPWVTYDVVSHGRSHGTHASTLLDN